MMMRILVSLSIKNVIQEFDNKNTKKRIKILEYLIDNEQFDLREIEDVDPRYSKRDNKVSFLSYLINSHLAL